VSVQPDPEVRHAAAPVESQVARVMLLVAGAASVPGGSGSVHMIGHGRDRMAALSATDFRETRPAACETLTA
jgi:hypothetical protein